MTNQSQQTFPAGNSHSLKLEMDESLSVLKISWIPDFFLEIVASIILIVLGIRNLVAGRVDDLILCAPFILVLLGITIHYASTKRAIECVIKKNLDTVQYVSGGVFSTHYFETKLDFSMQKIVGVAMRHNSKRVWEGFQIFVLLDAGEKISLTGWNLKFSECQILAEKIRNFINPQLPITAVD